MNVERLVFWLKDLVPCVQEIDGYGLLPISWTNLSESFPARMPMRRGLADEEIEVHGTADSVRSAAS
jgi:hypothetical protein